MLFFVYTHTAAAYPEKVTVHFNIRFSSLLELKNNILRLGTVMHREHLLIKTHITCPVDRIYIYILHSF